MFTGNKIIIEQTVNLKNVWFYSHLTKPIILMGFFIYGWIFIVKHKIMARRKEKVKAKPNRGNVVKRLKLLRRNEEILNKLK